MGLDTVELVMEVEEEFDVTVPDDGAETIRTVGDLYYWLVDRLGTPGVAGPCPSAAAFYRLRRVLIRQRAIPRDAIRPEARTADLLPEHDRRAAWDGLEYELGWRLPPLRLAGWINGTVAGLLLGLPPATFALCALGRLPMQAFLTIFWLEFLVGLLLFLVGFRLSRPQAVHLPPGCDTLGGLIGTSLALNRGVVGKQAAGTDARGDLWERLRRVVSEVAGIPPEQVTEDLDLIRDLA